MGPSNWTRWYTRRKWTKTMTFSRYSSLQLFIATCWACSVENQCISQNVNPFVHILCYSRLLDVMTWGCCVFWSHLTHSYSFSFTFVSGNINWKTQVEISAQKREIPRKTCGGRPHTMCRCHALFIQFPHQRSWPHIVDTICWLPSVTPLQHVTVNIAIHGTCGRKRDAHHSSVNTDVCHETWELPLSSSSSRWPLVNLLPQSILQIEIYFSILIFSNPLFTFNHIYDEFILTKYGKIVYFIIYFINNLQDQY